MPPARKVLWPILQVALTLGMVGWILHRNDGMGVLRRLATCDPTWLGLAVVFLVASILLGTWQWLCLLEVQGVSVEKLRLLRAYTMGMFLNFVLPSGVGGDVVRAVAIHKEAQGGTRGVAATLLDRFAGLFTLALFASIASWLLVAGHSEDLFRRLAWGSGLVSLAFCVATVVLFSRRVFGWFSPMARWMGEGVLLDKARDMRVSFLNYRNHPFAVAKVVGFSIVTQFLRLVVHWCSAKALGLPLDFAWILLFIPVVSLIAVLPLSVGGWGLREGAQKTFFSFPGVMPGLTAAQAVTGSLALAVSTSLLGMLVPAVLSLVAGVVIPWIEARDVEKLP